MNEREQKIHDVVRRLMAVPGDFEILKQAMQSSGLALLRQVETTPFPTPSPERLEASQEGVILDCETEGFDVASHDVLQLSMLKFRYDENGIVSLGDMFDRYRDPGRPITPEITGITGITDEMVRGQTISDQEVADFIGDATRVIAHKADFDRKFCEARFPDAGFDRKIWDCTLEQVDWTPRGARSRSLSQILLGQGMVFQAHNSKSDAMALAWALNTPDAEGVTAFAEMHEKSKLGHLHIIADNSPYNSKDLLKANGYYWAGPDAPVQGFVKVWHKLILASEENLQAERDLLRKVYNRDATMPAFEWDQMSRYSARPRQIRFETNAPKSVLEAFDMSGRTPEYSQSSFGW